MLMHVYLFDGLPEEELATLEKHAVIKRYRKNTVIMRTPCISFAKVGLRPMCRMTKAKRSF